MAENSSEIDFELDDIVTAGVVGLGAMGSGIAYHSLVQGFPIIAKEINDDALDAGKGRVEKLLSKLGRVKAQDYTPEVLDDLRDSITYTTDFSDLGPQEDEFDTPGIIIEAVLEREDIKKLVFGELDKVAHPDTILASNTSSLPISELAKVTSRPDKVIGMHFFNPVYQMKLVEIVMGDQTSEDTLEKVRDFATMLDKETVVVKKDIPGFLVNRMLMVYMNEAMRAIVEGKATVPEIDALLGPSGFGFPMGPFALADYVGLDVCSSVADILSGHFGSRLDPHPFLDEFVQFGQFGTKSRDANGDAFGIYHYSSQITSGSQPINPNLQTVLDKYKNAATPNDGPESSVERFIYPLVNEAFWCLQDELASPGDIDKSMKIGIAFRLLSDGRGPLQYAHDVGVKKVFDTLEDWAGKFGERYAPCDLLREYATRGESILDATGEYNELD